MFKISEIAAKESFYKKSIQLLQIIIIVYLHQEKCDVCRNLIILNEFDTSYKQSQFQFRIFFLFPSLQLCIILYWVKGRRIFQNCELKVKTTGNLTEMDQEDRICEVDNISKKFYEKQSPEKKTWIWARNFSQIDM